jgi:hypothetical protein
MWIFTLWLVCGFLAIIIAYEQHKYKLYEPNELFMIGFAIFILGPVSLLVQGISYLINSRKQ